MCLVAGACVRTGDFGRPQPSIWSDLVLPAAGTVAAVARDEPVSGDPLTDDEHELRDRAWRFVMPAHERQWFDRTVAELVRTRVLPVAAAPRDRDGYYVALRRESFRSPASRYARIAEDAAADARLVAPFVLAAARVEAMDRVRLQSLALVRDADAGQVYAAVARVAENRCLVAWVAQEVEGRAASYRYALEHMLIAAPQTQAIAAERALESLYAARSDLDRFGIGPLAGAACAGIEPIPAVRAVAPIAAKG